MLKGQLRTRLVLTLTDSDFPTLDVTMSPFEQLRRLSVALLPTKDRYLKITVEDLSKVFGALALLFWGRLVPPENMTPLIEVNYSEVDFPSIDITLDEALKPYADAIKEKLRHAADVVPWQDLVDFYSFMDSNDEVIESITDISKAPDLFNVDIPTSSTAIDPKAGSEATEIADTLDQQGEEE